MNSIDRLVSGTRRSVALSTLIVFQWMVIVVKSVVSLISWLRFGRPQSLADLTVTFGGDSLLALIAFVFLLSVDRIDALIAKHQQGQPARIRRWAATALDIAAGAFIAFNVAFYLLSTYVFWEWGAFLDSRHYEAMKQARVTTGVVYAVTRPQMLAPLAAFALVLIVVRLVHQRPNAYARVLGTTLLISFVLSFGTIATVASTRTFDPSTISPLVALYEPWELRVGDKLPADVPKPDLTGFAAVPGPREPRVEYRHYEGVARDMDVVVIVLESVRRSELAIYGYERETMPVVSTLANNALVFDDAYVTQPRSCKTMLSMSMGTFPDPRTPCEIWDPARFTGHENLFSRLRGAGYSTYFGTTGDSREERVGEFVRKITNGTTRVVGGEDLGIDASTAIALGRDDSLLVADYLKWAGSQTDRTAAVLWFDTAHFPYIATRRKFSQSETETVRDRYDDCLYSSDIAIGRLLRGLERSGKRERTLLVILGDHGEALGEQLDLGHGAWLYDHSMRIPFLIHNPAAFPARIDLQERVQPKDLPATLFYLLGLPSHLRQSEIVFAKSPDDRVYLSNVVQDLKLGMLTEEGLKFVYRPGYRSRKVFDSRVDPNELTDLRESYLREIPAWEADVVRWYYSQIEYIDKEFPPHARPPS